MTTTARRALVTGFPGFIARRLLRKLLAGDDDLHVTVLCEPSRESDAKREIARLKDKVAGDETVTERVTLMVGDVTAMDVGLSGPEFRSLTAGITELYHLAAIHVLGVDRKRAFAVNVEGTGNVLGLARAMRKLERFVHFSSTFVSGRRVGAIMEDELECGQQFHNTYEETKYQAEVLVQRARSRLPITVIRPSVVVGDSRTGEIDRFGSVYHIGMLLVGSPVQMSMPLPGEGMAPLNILPVDFLVDAVTAIASQPDTVGKTFHVVDPNPLSARRVYEAVAGRTGRRLPRHSVSPSLTKALLRIPGLERLAAVSHEVIDYLNHMAFYNSRNTVEALEGTGIRCPHFEDYVENLMQYVRDYFEHAGRWRDADVPDL